MRIKRKSSKNAFDRFFLGWSSIELGGGDDGGEGGGTYCCFSSCGVDPLSNELRSGIEEFEEASGCDV